MTPELTDAETLLAYLTRRQAEYREMAEKVPLIMDASKPEAAPVPYPGWAAMMTESADAIGVQMETLRAAIVCAKAAE